MDATEKQEMERLSRIEQCFAAVCNRYNLKPHPDTMIVPLLDENVEDFGYSHRVWKRVMRILRAHRLTAGQLDAMTNTDLVKLVGHKKSQSFALVVEIIRYYQDDSRGGHF